MTQIASESASAAIDDSAPSLPVDDVQPKADDAAPAPADDVTPAPDGDKTPEPTDDKDSESKVLKELKRARKRAQEAEKEAAYLRGVTETLKGGKPPETEEPKPLVPPKIEDFPDDYEAFRTAERKYYIEEAKRELRAEIDQKTQVTTQAERDRQVNSTFEAMIDKEAEDNPDFPDIVKEMGDRISKPMGRSIMIHKIAPELIMHFHNDPKLEKEVSKLCAQDPLAGAVRIGEIAHELSVKPKPAPPKKVTTAPKPVEKVDAAGPGPVDIDELPIGNYIKAKNEAERGRRKT